MTRPLPLWTLLSFLGACTSAQGDNKVDSSDSAFEEECSPLTFEEAQRIDEDALLEWLPGTGNFLPEHQGPGLALGDLNLDGFIDGLISVRSGGLLLLLNDGTGRFNAGTSVLVDGEALTDVVGVALSDLDSDGDLDAAVTFKDGISDRILTNQGDGSNWTSTELPTSRPGSLTPTFGDWNGDDRVDLFIPGFGNEFSPGDSEGKPHRLYIQDSDGSFVLENHRLPEKSRFGSAYLAQPFDADLDGDLDLFLVHDLPFLSQFLVNDGDGQFRDASSECLCTQVRAAMGVAIGDSNNDGLADFFVTGWQDNRFFVNAGDGSYYDQATAAGLVPANAKSEVGWGAQFADMDLDGDEDLLATFGGPTRNPQDHPLIDDDQQNALWLQQPDGQYEDYSNEIDWTETGRGRGLFTADMNRDNRPDVVVVTNAGVDVWHGSGGCPTGLNLTLQGSPGDPHGEGARITLHEQAGDRHVWMQRAGSFGNGPPEKLIARLAHNPFSALTIQWSDGHTQEVDVAQDATLLTVQRDE